MSGTRVPFDPELPVVVAVLDLPCGDRRFTRGDTLPWRELGLSDLDVARLYLTGHVDCVASESPRPAVAVPAQSVTAVPPSPDSIPPAYRVQSGERVNFTPHNSRRRRGR